MHVKRVEPIDIHEELHEVVVSEDRKAKAPDLWYLGNLQLINQCFQIVQFSLEALNKHLITIIVLAVFRGDKELEKLFQFTIAHLLQLPAHLRFHLLFGLLLRLLGHLGVIEQPLLVLLRPGRLTTMLGTINSESHCVLMAPRYVMKARIIQVLS